MRVALVVFLLCSFAAAEPRRALSECKAGTARPVLPDAPAGAVGACARLVAVEGPSGYKNTKLIWRAEIPGQPVPVGCVCDL